MDKTKEFIRLTTEHPDGEVIFMYPGEGSEYAYTMGSISRILVDEYIVPDERVWLRSEDENELYEQVCDNIADDMYKVFPLTDEQIKEVDELAKLAIDKMQWKKAIIVYINYQ